MTARKHRFPLWLGKLLWVVASPLLAVGIFILTCNILISLSSHGKIYDNKSGSVPTNPVGVVLGTSPLVAPNQPNLHFEARMEAAAALFNQGKIRHILVSGSRNSRYYNEVRDMRKALVARGIPDQAITEDPSGFRTLDSVVRAATVFGQVRYTIISDDFHVSRAVFLAQVHHSDVVGYAAEGVSVRHSMRSRAREIFARVKAVLDVYLLDTKPREPGGYEPIRVAQT
ncbi:MAG: ElyC/SanA/YdcF family protein [Verrucomicrobiota bacterium]